MILVPKKSPYIKAFYNIVPPCLSVLMAEKGTKHKQSQTSFNLYLIIYIHSREITPYKTFLSDSLNSQDNFTVTSQALC